MLQPNIWQKKIIHRETSWDVFNSTHFVEFDFEHYSWPKPNELLVSFGITYFGSTKVFIPNTVAIIQNILSQNDTFSVFCPLWENILLKTHIFCSKGNFIYKFLILPKVLLSPRSLKTFSLEPLNSSIEIFSIINLRHSYDTSMTLFVWPHDRNPLQTFFEHSNSQHRSI